MFKNLFGGEDGWLALTYHVDKNGYLLLLFLRHSIVKLNKKGNVINVDSWSNVSDHHPKGITVVS